MRLLKAILLLLILGLAAYAFWPRTPSLKDFEPARLAKLQVEIWNARPARINLEVLVASFHIYAGEYHLPPAAAAAMAFDAARAFQIFQTAADAPDQEAALVPLERVFTRLKDGTRTAFDPHLAARLQLAIWALRTETSRQAELVAAWSEFLGLLYGCPSRQAVPAAKSFVSASGLAKSGKSPAAEKAAEDGWRQVQQLGKIR